MSHISLPAFSQARLRILSLEDEPRDAELIQATLRSANLAFDFRRVATEPDYLTALKSESFDLVLADYSLPETDGIAALRLCHEHRPECPFIFVSGSLGEELAIDTLKQGAADYVLKDHLDRLPRAVERALREVHERAARRFAEKSLRESEEKYRDLVENLNDLVYVLDLKGRLTFVSSASERLLGYRPAEVMGRAFTDFIFEEDLPTVLSEFQLHMQGRFIPLEFRIVAKSGEVRWANVSTRPSMQGGQMVGIAGLLTDITERKRAEEALRTSVQRFQDIAAHAQEWIWEVGTDGRYTYSSQMVESMLGYTPEEVRQKHFYDFFHPDDLETLKTAAFAAFSEKQPFREFINRNVHKDGRTVWLSTSGLPVFDANGNVIGYRGADTDITQRKRIEEERQKLQAQLIQAQKMEAVGLLAGGVAHDFNNILAAIMMNLDLLKEYPNLNQEIEQMLGELEASAKRAADLTRQLLMFSRRSVLEIKVLDLNEIVANLLKMLGRLIGEDIYLQFQRKTGLPAVEADACMLEQVLMNLCVNARDAMSKGGRITISTETIEVGKEHARTHANRRPGLFVCLSVADTGCGMDETTLKRIFEPFFTTKEVGKGTGLGLATVHGIVTQHQGWVEVESQLGVGTAFHVFLPASNRKAAAAENVKLKAARGHETILLVEDEWSVRRTLVRSLQVLGYRVLEAGNGLEAMRLWQEHHHEIDLLFSDMVMPEGMTGLELAERLRAEKPDLSIIISSGYSSVTSQLTGVIEDGVVYLPKPYQISLLGEKVRESLNRK